MPSCAITYGSVFISACSPTSCIIILFTLCQFYRWKYCFICISLFTNKVIHSFSFFLPSNLPSLLPSLLPSHSLPLFLLPFVVFILLLPCPCLLPIFFSVRALYILRFLTLVCTYIFFPQICHFSFILIYGLVEVNKFRTFMSSKLAVFSFIASTYLCLKNYSFPWD